MGLEGVASVELKPINAQRVLSAPMYTVDAEASLLRPLGLPKPMVVGTSHFDPIGGLWVFGF